MMQRTFLLTLITLILLGTGLAYANFKPGTYTGMAISKKDKKHSGVIEVEVTVSATKIENIKVVTFEQSKEHKRFGPPLLEVKEKTPAAIIATQAFEVDSVAKATMASNALQLAVARAVHKATVGYKPGTYTGKALGRTNKKYTGVVEVEVTVSDTKIENIKIVTLDQSVSHKTFGPPLVELKEKTPAAIIATQAFEVDTVARATMASNALQLAVARALQQAR